MNQALYAHMNNKRKMKKNKNLYKYPNVHQTSTTIIQKMFKKINQSFFFFLQNWSLNSGLCTCQARALPQFFLLYVFFE
jgi:hypothetical protein